MRCSARNHAELVAAEAGDQVPAPHAAEQPPCDRLQKPIADGVAISVVDLFEAIEIEKHHRDQAVAALARASARSSSL